ncbi:MAG TPA: hypothetical protein VK841_22525 [Polyangiaceae bacterium]|jgi:hypothetical protein|nr:hypothetical protein [Polyangiaceae bacterium]
MAARKNSDESRLMITLTVPQLRAIVREELMAALRELQTAPDTSRPPTDEEMAAARKKWADIMSGKLHGRRR